MAIPLQGPILSEPQGVSNRLFEHSPVDEKGPTTFGSWVTYLWVPKTPSDLVVGGIGQVSRAKRVAGRVCERHDSAVACADH